MISTEGDVIDASLLDALLYGHERDLSGNLRRFPLIARFKLDRAGVAISLDQWQALTYPIRRQITVAPIASDADVAAYRIALDEIGRVSFGAPFAAARAEPEPHEYAPGAAMPARLVEALINEGLAVPDAATWNALPELARFGLLKLSRAGHQNRRLAAFAFDLFGARAAIPSGRRPETST